MAFFSPEVIYCTIAFTAHCAGGWGVETDRQKEKESKSECERVSKRENKMVRNREREIERQ